MAASNWLKVLEEDTQQGEMCDFNIKVQGEVFPVHRRVLASSSGYFNSIFTNDAYGSNLGVIEIQDVSVEAVKICLEFMYSASLNIDHKLAIEVLKLAHMWQLDEVVNTCQLTLQIYLSIDCCFLYRRLACFYGLKDLLLYCNEVIFSNISLLMDSNEILDLTLPELLEILQDEAGINCNAVDLWKFCVRWSTFSNQLCHVVQTFPLERFKTCDILGLIFDDTHLRNCAECHEIVSRKFLDFKAEPTVENCLRMKQIANRYNCEVTKKKLTRFIVRKHRVVFMQEDFISYVSPDDLLEYISHLRNAISTTNKRGEYLLVVISWFKFSPEREGIFSDFFDDYKIKRNVFLSRLLHSIRYLKPDDILFLKLLSSKHSCRLVEECTDDLILENFSAVIALSESLKFSLEDLLLYVKNPKSYNPFPSELWYFILKWVDHDYETRKENFPAIYDALLLDQFRPEFVRDDMRNCRLVRQSSECMSRLLDAVCKDVEKMKHQNLMLMEKIDVVSQKVSSLEADCAKKMASRRSNHDQEQTELKTVCKDVEKVKQQNGMLSDKLEEISRKVISLDTDRTWEIAPTSPRRCPLGLQENLARQLTGEFDVKIALLTRYVNDQIALFDPFIDRTNNRLSQLETRRGRRSIFRRFPSFL